MPEPESFRVRLDRVEFVQPPALPAGWLDALLPPAGAGVCYAQLLEAKRVVAPIDGFLAAATPEQRRSLLGLLRHALLPAWAYEHLGGADLPR